MHLESPGTPGGPRAYNVRRRDSRYVCSIPITVQRFLRFGPIVTRGVTLDISMRGMSALVCGAPRVGETVVLELPSRGAAVEMLATVHYSSDAKSGFEFYPLSPIAQQGIQDWIEDLCRHDEGVFSCPLAFGAKVGSD